MSASVAGSTRVTVSGAKWIVDGTPVEWLMLLREALILQTSDRRALQLRTGRTRSFLKRALDSRRTADSPRRWRPGHRRRCPLHSNRPAVRRGDRCGRASSMATWCSKPAHFERAKRLGVTIVQNPSHFMLPAVMAPRLGTRTARLTDDGQEHPRGRCAGGTRFGRPD